MWAFFLRQPDFRIDQYKSVSLAPMALRKYVVFHPSVLELWCAWFALSLACIGGFFTVNFSQRWFFISGDHRSGHKQNSANTQDTNCGRLCEGHVQYLVILHTLLGNIYNINQSRNRAAPRGQLFQKAPRQKTSHITIQTAENHFLCT